MAIDTAMNTIALDGPRADTILALRRLTSRFVFDHRDVRATPDDIAQATDFISSISSINLPLAFVAALLDLHPRARVLLATQGMQSEEVRNEIADAVSLTFLGCPWPRERETVFPEGDRPYDRRKANSDSMHELGIPFDVFLHRLHRQASLFMEGK